MSCIINNSNRPPACVLKNFDKFSPLIVKDDYSYPIIKSHLWIFCETKLPIFGDDWSSQDTFDPQISWTVVNVTLGKPSHPEQIGYILLWDEGTSNPSPGWRSNMVHNLLTGQAILVGRRGAIWGSVAETLELPLKFFLLDSQTEGWLLPLYNHIYCFYLLTWTSTFTIPAPTFSTYPPNPPSSSSLSAPVFSLPTIARGSYIMSQLFLWFWFCGSTSFDPW